MQACACLSFFAVCLLPLTPEIHISILSDSTPCTAVWFPLCTRHVACDEKTPLPAQPPVRELDEDAPSPVSSPGEEYELPVPEASEDQEGRGEGGEDGGGEEEDGGGEEEMDVDDDDEGGGDDDDEEEYTMDGEPEEDEVRSEEGRPFREIGGRRRGGGGGGVARC